LELVADASGENLAEAIRTISQGRFQPRHGRFIQNFPIADP